MNTPKPFTMMIAGHRWQIIWKEQKAKRWAFYNWPERTIEVDPRAIRKGKKKLLSDLRHEVGHGIHAEIQNDMAERLANAVDESMAELDRKVERLFKTPRRPRSA